jgi:hypothetical protein
MRRCGLIPQRESIIVSKKPTIKLDPDDGLIVGEVGPWATEKHDRVARYIQASRGARAKFLPPNGTGGASYIELYSGAGRSLITGTNQIIDGSPIVAFKAACDSGHRFSEIHLSDLEPQNSSALAQRIKALGGAATSYNGNANIVVDQIMNAINPYGLHLAFLDPFKSLATPIFDHRESVKGAADGYDHPRQLAGFTAQPRRLFSRRRSNTR